MSSQSERDEFLNQANRLITLVVVVLMLAGWMFRDVLEHKRIEKTVDAAREEMRSEFQDLKQFITDKMENPNRWEKAIQIVR